MPPTVLSANLLVLRQNDENKNQTSFVPQMRRNAGLLHAAIMSLPQQQRKDHTECGVWQLHFAPPLLLALWLLLGDDK